MRGWIQSLKKASSMQRLLADQLMPAKKLGFKKIGFPNPMGMKKEALAAKMPIKNAKT